MRVLITGGSGFIAAWVMRRFAHLGATFRSLDLRTESPLARRLLGDRYDTIEWIAGDVSDAGTVRGAARDCDLIIHLAAMLTPACQAEPLRGAAVNLLGTLHVFDAAMEFGMARVLYMSSAGVFGPDDGLQPRPTTHYGAFKLAGEGSARAFWEDRGMPSTGFRPLIVYGPGPDVGLTAGPSIACDKAAHGESYTIPFGGSSDFVFVDDVAAAFELAWTEPLDGAHVFNVVGEHAAVSHVATTINEYVGHALVDASGPEIPVTASIDEGELREMFPELPHTPLSAGIAQTIDFYGQTP